MSIEKLFVFNRIMYKKKKNSKEITAQKHERTVNAFSLIPWHIKKTHRRAEMSLKSTKTIKFQGNNKLEKSALETLKLAYWCIVICYNYTHIHAYACRIHLDAMIIKTSEDFFKKIYLSLYLKGLRVRGSWRPNKDCNILTSPAPSDIAMCCSPGLLNRRPVGSLR